jgi:hypothetical protein
MKILMANHFDVVAVSSIAAENKFGERSLTQLDRHPRPETNEAIAQYLWDRVGERLEAAPPLKQQIGRVEDPTMVRP